MASYQVRYWFDRNDREAAGEWVSETAEAPDPAEVARKVEAKLAQPSFVITPSAGPAQAGGLVIVRSALVRYTEVIPVPISRY